MTSWWTTLSPGARKTYLASVAALLAMLASLAWWLLRPEPAVLFSDLRPQDAAALAGELDRLKIPYSLADNGATLLVERSQVPAVRMKLMGRDVPLHGTVGLELFNTTDFGMTEFAQKVNFQRALQGELTRTILSFPEVRDARVHLVLPEQGLFKQNASRAKAAITLMLRPGHALRPEQVQGIQRLAAAAVPGLAAQEVTIVNGQGVTLSRGGEAEGEGGGARLELKRDTEAYLAKKAAAVLDQAFGPGQALASVDVTLNMDQVRVTTEDVIAAPDPRNGVATGVLVRERESARDNASDPRAGDTRGARGSSMQRDTEYQAGRRVEQVVSQPGTIRRMHVVAIVREPLDAGRVEQVQRLVAAAVGAAPERGDSVVVQSLQSRAEAQAPASGSTAIAPAPATAAAPNGTWLAGTLGAALLLAMGALLLRVLRHRRARTEALPLAQRQETLQRVQAWLLEPVVETETVATVRGGVAE